MRFYTLKAIAKAAVRGAAVLLLGAGAAATAQTVNLTAGPSTLTLPDGSAVPMWGYSCQGATSGATCAAANPNASGWSPVIITVPAASSLNISLTNSLTFQNGNSVPTSLTIVGQLGGGLGTDRKTVLSPDHTNSQGATTWPIAGGAGVTPPPQPQRVQSFATEVAAGATTQLTWSNLRPGTYLIESGTHPSIQGPMGLYGMLVVTAAPSGATPGTAYPGVSYNAEVPMLFSEIDPVQNNSVSTAVNTAGFSETAVWSGVAGACGDPAVHNCYPPAVNYTPLYYTINGVGFNKASSTSSVFAATAGVDGSLNPVKTGISGNVLVRLVNAGLRMHIPSIVGSLTTPTGSTSTASATPGFSLVAEDGNVLPGVQRVQNEVFMAAGKTYDVMINAPPTGSNPLPIFDRQLSLSAGSTNRDAGMLAYISVNGSALPASLTSASSKAYDDAYNAVVAGQTLKVSDAGKGVIANDVNIYAVKVAAAPSQGSLTLNADGTFTYVASAGWSGSDSFTYCGNGASDPAVPPAPTTNAACATVTLKPSNIASSTIAMGNSQYNSNLAAYIKVAPSGVLSADQDSNGLPLSVVLSSVVASTGLTVHMDKNTDMDVTSDGGFTATAVKPGTYTFAYMAQNSQGTLSGAPNTVCDPSTPVAGCALVTIVFPTPTGLKVFVKDPTSNALISDYRWIIEEDRTFYIDPSKTTTTASSVPFTFGTNFHTSFMPVVATGCTGPNSCEGGQSTGGGVQKVACDIGNGVCRPDTTGNGFTVSLPGDVALDPKKRYYISVLPGDAANAFESGNLSASCLPDGSDCGHGMGGAPIQFPQQGAQVTVLVEQSPYPPSKLSVFVFEDDFPLNGEQDAGGGVDVLAPNEPGLGGFNITIFDDAGGSGDATGQVDYDMFNQPLSNSLAGTLDPSNGNDACPIGNSRAGSNSDGTYDQTQLGITGTIVTCPKYESDGKTLSPLAGQAVVANMMPGRYGIVATPAADRIARGEEWLQTNTLDGQKAHDSFLRIGEAGYFQEYGPAGYHVTIGFANPKIINSRLAAVCNGSDINITGTNCTNTVTGRVSTERMSRTPDERLYGSGSYNSFGFTQCYVSFGDPDGEDFAFTKCDSNGNFTLSGLPDGSWRVTVFDQWNDMLVDGLSTPVALGGGSLSSPKSTDMGEIAINQWQANIYTTTFFDKNGNGVRDPNEEGLALVPTNVRFRDGSYSNFNNTDLEGNAGFNEEFPLFSWYVIETDSTRYANTGTHVVYDAGGPADGSVECKPSITAACGSSTIGQNMANTVETVPVPTALRVPGAYYCATADCNDAPAPLSITGQSGSGAGGSTGRVDPAWVKSEGWQGFSGQNNFLEFGKRPFAEATASTPAENGGIRGHVVYASTRPFDDPTLLLQLSWEPLVPDVTINLYQKGFAADGVTETLKLVDSTKTSSWDEWAQGFRSDGVPNMNCPGQTASDPFFFSLYNQPQWLDAYNNGGTPAHSPTDPNYHNAQFKCYDGMHNWNQLQPAPYDGMYQFPSIVDRDPVSGAPTGGTNPNVAGTNCTICIKNPVDGTPMLPSGKYVVEMITPQGYEIVKEEDKNILIGDNFIAPVTVQFPGLGGSIYILPDQAAVAGTYNGSNAQNGTTDLGRTTFPSTEADTGSVEVYWPCVGASRVVPDFISLFPGSAEVSPFAGAQRKLCDRKEVTLNDQASVLAKFYVFTETHAAAHFTGVITDDFTSEFDPYSPQFGEKFAPPNLPISIKDWKGNETQRVYTDQWGAYNGLTYSTWEVNPPNPTGYSPTMMVTCMNDPGTGPTPDPLFNPGYSQFCYEIPFMPGQTQYMDTPVTPTTAFSEGYNHPDCAYPDATPGIKEVDGDTTGPWVAAVGSGYVTSVAVSAGGTYSAVPTVAFGTAAPAGGTRATGTAILSKGVASVHVVNGGKGYSVAPNVTFSSPQLGSTLPTATAVLNGYVFAVNVTNGGSYAAKPNATIVGDGHGAVLSVSFAGGKVTAVTVTNSGTGYTHATVNFSGGSGSGAQATPVLQYGVSAITITTNGAGYSAAPAVIIDPPPAGGTQATATAALQTTGKVTAVIVTNAGSNYPATPPPSVNFTRAGTDHNTGNAVATASVKATTASLTITALGDQTVLNNAYSGPSATTAPFNQKTVTRHYGFGSQCTSATASGCTAVSSVTIGVDSTGKPIPATVQSWADDKIVVTVPSGVQNCAVQQQAIYGGSTAQCGELSIIRGDNGKTSIDTITVTIGGKAPTVVTPTTPMTATGPGSLQTAIDNAEPGDLLMLAPGVYNEMVLMWKPVRLQGVGAASSVINANTQPEGKMDPWRQKVNCLFGLALNGQPSTGTGGNPFDSSSSGATCGGWPGFNGGPNNPQVDRLPLEGILGWDTTVNGNLAQLLQEPTLMGAYEGAGITVLAKGVNIPAGSTDIFGSGAESAFPTGTTLLTSSNCLPGGNNPYPSNFQCNPSSIDGLSVTNSSQGGGGIFVHAWAHNLQIANNRVYNNSGTLTGGITVGQGESPDAYLQGDAGNADPGSCESSSTTGLQLPYCFNLHVNVHHNSVSLNSSIGDELFSSTPAGGGGVTMCIGDDYYKFNFNWVCGNLSTGDGGGLVHLGFIKNGDIEHNSFLFNESTNPTVPTNGGGLIVMGAPPDGLTATGLECGNTAADADCVPGLSEGTGPNLMINANLFQGNAAESGSGGGIRFQGVNGTDVINFPTRNTTWNNVTVENNIIVNNVAGWDGAGISLQDALNVNIINNTIMSNDTTASAGVLFNTLGAPLASSQGPTCTSSCGTTSAPQPAGIVTMQHSAVLASTLGTTKLTCPAGHANCNHISDPILDNNVIWQNRAFYIGVDQSNLNSTDQTNQQATVALYNAFTTNKAASQPSADVATGNGSTGGGVIITGGTGACDQNASYWDVGVRGDKGPSDHFENLSLKPRYSVITDVADYPGANNTGVNPTVVSQYCNGSRTPPENGTMGYQVPPGISDATVPNPVFNLTPAATVDEGNNWINISWGPLALINTVSNTVLGNYSITTDSSALDYVPTTAPTYAEAPGTDFFGNGRKTTGNPKVDAGAVEYQRVLPAVSSIAPNTGERGTSVNVTITGTNLAGATALTGLGTSITAGPLTVNAAGTQLTTTLTILPGANQGVHTIGVTTPLGTTGTVNFTVTGVTGLTFTSAGLTSTPTNRTVKNGTVTVHVAGTGPLTIGPAPTLQPVSGTGTFLITGGTCTAGAVVNAGATCTINVRYTPPATPASVTSTFTVTVNGTGLASAQTSQAITAN